VKPARGSRAARACVAAVAVLAVAGCGTTSPSDKQLRAQATAICARANRLLGRIGTPSSAAAGEPFLQRGIATLKPELQQLKQLSAPSDSANVWSIAIRTLSAELAALQSTVAKIDGGADPVAAFKSLQQTLAPLETQANNAWQALQIPACQNQ
jgi:hypothetical protein